MDPAFRLLQGCIPAPRADTMQYPSAFRRQKMLLYRQAARCARNSYAGLVGVGEKTDATDIYSSASRRDKGGVCDALFWAGVVGCGVFSFVMHSVKAAAPVRRGNGLSTPWEFNLCAHVASKCPSRLPRLECISTVICNIL